MVKWLQSEVFTNIIMYEAIPQQQFVNIRMYVLCGGNTMGFCFNRIVNSTSIYSNLHHHILKFAWAMLRYIRIWCDSDLHIYSTITNACINSKYVDDIEYNTNRQQHHNKINEQSMTEIESIILWQNQWQSSMTKSIT